MLPIISNKKSSKTTNLCDGKRHIMEFDRTPWKIANVKKKRYDDRDKRALFALLPK